MKFYQRAWANIFRHKIKSIILLLVSFILSTGIIISFLINSAIEESTQVMLNRSNAAVTLSLNSRIEESDIKKIGSSSYVKYYDYNINSIISSDDIEHYTGKVKSKLKDNQEISDYFDANFNLTGINDPELLLIRQNKASLVKGSLLDEKEIKGNSNSVIVTSKFAQANNLNIGSTFDITASRPNDEGSSERVYTLKVKGIIELEEKNTNLASIESDENIDEELALEMEKANYQNLILVPNSTTKNINEFLKGGSSGNNQANTINTTPVFILDSPHSLANFIDEETLNLPEGASFVSDYDNIQQSISSTKILNNIASIAFITMTFLTVAILALVVILFLVNRKQEIGIYLALGEKKYKTIAQIVLETYLVGLIGFLLAISLSSMVANTVSQSIIKNTSTMSSQEETTNISDVVPYLDDSQINDNYIANTYQIRISINNVVAIILIGSTTLIVSSIGPLIYIMRLRPKDILL